MEFIKNQKKSLILYLIVAVLAIVTLIVYISNVSAPYYEDMNSSVVIMIVIALVTLAASLVLSQFSGGKLIHIAVDVLRIATAVLVILAAGIFISMRVESFAYIYGSNLELGNEAAFSAAGQAVTCIILFVVTWLLAIVGSFLQVGKKNA